MMEKEPKSTPEHDKSDDVDEDSDSTSSKDEETSERDEQKQTRGKEDHDERRAAFFRKKEEQAEQAEERPEQEDTLAGEPDAVAEAEDYYVEKTSEAIQESEESAESLTEAEAHEAVQAIIEARAEELSEELNEAEEGSAEELEAMADALFLESLREEADQNEDLTEETIAEAYEQALEDLSLEAPADDEGLNEEDVTELEPELGAVEAEEPAEDEEVVPPPPPSPPTPPVPPTPPIPPAGGSGGPPLPPVTPYTRSFGVGGPTPPTAPTPAPLEAARPRVDTEQRRRKGSNMLVGAIVGYIIGRRGGRKRTEKKLLPKIDQLEREVKELHDVITERETRIRKLAREAAEKSGKAQPERAIKILERHKVRVEQKKVDKQKTERMARPSVEKLGVLNLKSLEIFRERRVIDGNENSPKRKPVEIMTPAELIEKVADVKIDGLSVVEAYQTGRIEQETLREVTKRYLRSGDYELVFRRELRTHPEELKTKRRKLEHLQVSSGEAAPDRNVAADSPAVLDNQLRSTVKPLAPTSTSTRVSLPDRRPVSGPEQRPAGKKIPLPWIVGVTAIVTFLLLLLLTRG